MILNDDIELIEGLPVLYIRSLKAIAISDLHLGYEGGMAKSGMAIPKINLRNITRILEKAISGREVQRMFIVGDVKNDFSEVSGEELNELRGIVKFLKEKRIAVDVIKGNHDNFIASYAHALGIVVHGEHLKLGEYLFSHGDKTLPVSVTAPTLIIGHEHPSIGIRTKAGTIERFRCFLHGELKHGKSKIRLIVLPAIGYFETGSDVNIPRGRTMSPLLKKAGVDQMRAIAIGDGSTLDFGKVGDLRNVTV